jgi:sulfite oxidase
MDYSNEPPHSELLVVKGKEPFNAEPEVSALVEFKYTPEDLVYCRNHGPVRELEEDGYTVTVNGAVDTPLKLSMRDLRTQFQKAQVVAALQVCRMNLVPNHLAKLL